MKLNVNEQLAQQPQSDYDKRLYQSLYKIFREISNKVNQIAAGTFAGYDGALSAAPASGTWARGDYVRNAVPAQVGTAGSRYIVKGWTRVTDGANNVLNTDWFEDRASTGN